MQRQKVEMEELSDIMAFRVIVEDEAACYRALGIIHRKYPMVMGRFKITSRRPSATVIGRCIPV